MVVPNIPFEPRRIRCTAPGIGQRPAVSAPGGGGEAWWCGGVVSDADKVEIVLRDRLIGGRDEIEIGLGVDDAGHRRQAPRARLRSGSRRRATTGSSRCPWARRRPRVGRWSGSRRVRPRCAARWSGPPAPPAGSQPVWPSSARRTASGSPRVSTHRATKSARGVDDQRLGLGGSGRRSRRQDKGQAHRGGADHRSDLESNIEDARLMARRASRISWPARARNSTEGCR